jgi:ornithine cyclodeaminase/alanine dehydrogenase-like protein (mu-crystallin family)
MEPISVRFISQSDIINAGCFDIPFVIREIEDVLIEYKSGKVLLPDKISQVFDEKIQNRINCMPSTLLSRNICGVKWVSVFPQNPKLYNTPNVSGLIILSELNKGYPYAVMDGSFVTAIRTACIGAVGAKHLARKNCAEIGFIGAGEQAKMHFLTMKSVCPTIKTCKVASRTSAREDEFVRDLRKIHKDVTFIKCGGDFEYAAEESDIIVTATSTQAPLLKARAIKEGAFYCHVGGWEDEYDVPLKADKIVCDQWESVKHRTQTISLLYKAGKLRDEDIYGDIADIVDGTFAGRENDNEFIYFNSVGLSFIDVAVADSMYKRVVSKDLGADLTLQDKGIFDYNPEFFI